MTGNRTQKVNAAGTVNYEYGSGNRISGWSFAATGAVEVYVDVHGHASEPIGTDPRWGERTVNGLSVEVSGTNFWVSNVPLGAGTQEIVAAISDEAGNVGRTTNTVVVKIATNGAYQFDAAGNVTNIAYAGLGTVGLAWDGWYMLKSVATNGATAESYTYDAFGRRVKIAKGTNTLCLVYDGPHCIAELATNGVPVRSYTYGPGIDNVLAMTVHQPDVRTYYYIKDHLGSVLALTDESGALVESYSYDAWGRVLGVYDGGGAEIAESSVGNRILWQGREYSWSTGLYYFRARWYDPITGRWLSNDPIGILGGLNQYVFCANNSVNMADPRGLDVWLINDPDATPAHGHSAVIIGQNGVFVYFSFGPSDDSGSSGRYTGAVNGSLATQGFTSLAAALRYAKSQGYGRYAHYKTDPCADAAGTRAAGAFANACFHGSVNNCQILVNAVMSAMGVIFSGTSDPNYSYQRNRSQADDWGGL